MYIYFIRHGDPIYESDSITEYGKKQSDALMRRLLLEGINTIYCSTSTRAIMTAEPLIKELGIKPILLDWMKEEYGWEKISELDEKGNRRWMFMIEKYRHLFHDEEVLALGDKWYEHPYFKDTFLKEEIEKTQQNVDKFLKNLGFLHNKNTKTYKFIGPKNQKEKRVAVFAHGGVGAEFLANVLDIPYNIFATRFEFYTSHYTIIYFDENTDLVIPRIQNFNDDSHLYKEDLLEGSIYRNIKKQK